MGIERKLEKIQLYWDASSRCNIKFVNRVTWAINNCLMENNEPVAHGYREGIQYYSIKLTVIWDNPEDDA
jgi:hypothetical protein